MPWRLGLTIATNAIGWATLGLDDETPPNPLSLMAAGVRVFSDGRTPKDKTPLAAQRRVSRGKRTRRDHYLKRRNEFMEKLVRHGLMPAERAARKALERLDPWELRVRGLDEALSLHELGRALFHLQQRRGFRFNRKAETGEEDDGKKIKQAAARARAKMQEVGARTMGELLARARIEDPKAARDHPVRIRLRGTGAEAFYDFYPLRDMVAQEFDALWAAQTHVHGAALADDAYEDLRDTLLFQRPFRHKPVGKCALDPSDDRAPRALPSQQRLRILREINRVGIWQPGGGFHALGLEQRDRLVAKALATRKLTFDAAHKLLELPERARIHDASDPNRKHLDGDLTAALLASKKRWGPRWRTLSFEAQESIVERLLAAEDEDDLVAWLMEAHALERDSAEAVCAATSDRSWPQGQGRLGRGATRKVLAALEADVIPYDAAVEAAGYSGNADLELDGEVFDALPYYGKVLHRYIGFGTGDPKASLETRFGKLGNPTVHVALNQVRKVVNALMKQYGPPAQIVVELARGLPLSAKGQAELDGMRKANQKADERRGEHLSKLGRPDNDENRLRLQLWEELNPQDPSERRCPLTGERIDIERLFSDEVEVIHVLPVSLTLDDGVGNKTLIVRRASRGKGRRAPYQAFSRSKGSYDWNMISALVANLPPGKNWRFRPDVMQRFQREQSYFLRRHLEEARHLSRLVKTYLMCTGAEVWVTRRQLTARLWDMWGLGSRNRDDHRHHAIDAIVVGLTDRGLLDRLSRAARQAEERCDRRPLAALDDPWPDFRDHVRRSVMRMVVSHKADHGVQGRLHEDTAYGVVKDPETGAKRLASRKAITDLTAGEIRCIGDMKIRRDLLQRTGGVLDPKALRAELERYSRETGVRRVRIHKVLNRYEVIRHGDGYQKAVSPREICWVDIFEASDGMWKGVGVSRFDANQRDGISRPRKEHPYTRHVMRVYKDDLIKLNKNGAETIMRVARLRPSKNSFNLAENYQAGDLDKRHNDPADAFRWDVVSSNSLRHRRARIVRVDPVGRVFDPGVTIKRKPLKAEARAGARLAD